MIIDGKKISQKIVEKLKLQPRPKKILAAVLVGSHPVSESFLKQKEKVAKELGIDFRLYRFDEKLKNDDLRREIGRIANQKPIGGVIVQLPLPKHLNQHYILNAIPREKDIDVLGERALGAFYTDRNPILPPAVGTTEEILRMMNKELRIMKVIVVGSGFLVGKPIAVWLQDKVAELTIFNKNTKDLRNKLKNADLIISGTGKANLFSGEDLTENTTVIDFGYSIAETNNRQGAINKRISGDFDSSLPPTQNPLLFYTPTPGGTGPILVAKVFENFYKLNI